MSNLVPEQRLDKNNRLVTRHVRAGGKEAGKQFAPAPKIANSVLSETAIVARDSLFTLSERMKAEYCDHAQAVIKQYSPNTLETIGRYLERDGKISVTQVIELINKESETTVREYYEYIDSAPESHDDRETITRCINGVRWYFPEGAFPDLTDVPESQKQEFRALIRVASVVHSWMEEDHPLAEQEFYGNRKIINVIGSRELVDILIKNPERGNEIAEFMKEREYSTVEDIKAYLDSELHSAISEGFL